MKKTFLSACLFFASVFAGIDELKAMRNIILNVEKCDETTNNRKVDLRVGGRHYETDTNTLLEICKQNKNGNAYSKWDVPGLPGFKGYGIFYQVDLSLKPHICLGSGNMADITIPLTQLGNRIFIKSFDEKNNVSVDIPGGQIQFGGSRFGPNKCNNFTTTSSCKEVELSSVVASNIFVMGNKISTHGKITAADKVTLSFHDSSVLGANTTAKKLTLNGTGTSSNCKISHDIIVDDLHVTGLNDFALIRYYSGDTAEYKNPKLIVNNELGIHCRYFNGTSGVIQTDYPNKVTIQVDHCGKYEPAMVTQLNKTNSKWREEDIRLLDENKKPIVIKKSK